MSIEYWQEKCGTLTRLLDAAEAKLAAIQKLSDAIDHHEECRWWDDLTDNPEEEPECDCLKGDLWRALGGNPFAALSREEKT